MSDSELLALSYKKPAHFAELFERHHGRFFAIARRALGSKDEAEDVVQETFVRIYKYSQKFLSESGDFNHWSNAILRNLIIDQIRKNQKRDFQLTEEMEAVLASKEDTSAESMNYFTSITDRVGGAAADILKLRFVLGRSFKEIGKALGITSGAARVRVMRAKRAYIKVNQKMNHGE
jgi:RNA polymerase sigma-70 factor, ECF subfamily